MKRKGNGRKLKNISQFFLRLAYAFKSMSFVKHILILYVTITITGSVLLYLPVTGKIHVDYINALFISASAFSDTGLTTVNTALTFNYFGQAVIAILILIGGIGWFALKIYFFNILLDRPISFASRDALAAERGSSKVGFTRHIIKVSVSMLFCIMLVSIVIMTLLFFYLVPDSNPFHVTNDLATSVVGTSTPGSSLFGKAMVNEDPHGNFLTSFRFGVFHTISSINNAGFDIIGGNSVAPYYHQYALQILFMLLFIIGGIGYPVLYDIYCYFYAKRHKQKFQWSLFSKLSMTTYLIVAVIGVGSTFAVELTAKDSPVYDINNLTGGGHAMAYTFWHNPMYGSNGDKTMALIFNSMSTRNAGFASVRLGDMAQPTILIWSIMMFIGSAPSSTAGGIRTTTLAIVFIGLWNKIRGRDEVRVFNRRISNDTVTRSYIVFAMSVALLLLSSIIAYTTFAPLGGKANSSIDTYYMSIASDGAGHYKFVPTAYTLNELIFEGSSAFGTTGLTAGLTPLLSAPAKIVFILLMFIGQLGVSSSVLIWRARSPKSKHYNYVEEDVTTG